MVGSRTLTALVGLLLSLLVSAIAWYQFHSLVLFLLVPFVPFLLRGGREDDAPAGERTCPSCDFRSADPAVRYCPRDGSRLE